MKTKTCTGCKLLLPLKQFSFDKNRSDGRCYYCKDCYIINERRQRVNYADRRTHLNLMRDFGISLDIFKQISKSQQDVCAICEKPAESRLCVDHDHTTGRLRGLLCQPCNKMLAAACDNPEILNKGIEYLNRPPLANSNLSIPATSKLEGVPPIVTP